MLPPAAQGREIGEPVIKRYFWYSIALALVLAGVGSGWASDADELRARYAGYYQPDNAPLAPGSATAPARATATDENSGPPSDPVYVEDNYAERWYLQAEALILQRT